MAKPPAYDLTDAERRDLTQLIQAGKPLPEKYRFILFEDKREVELVWNGKNRDVCTTVLPFQTLEHVDEPRAETKMQHELFDARVEPVPALPHDRLVDAVVTPTRWQNLRP